MEENLQKVVLINNEAESDSALIRRAQLDTMGMEDPLYVYSDALGQNLGRYFREALSENRLPKTKLIFGNGMAGRAGGLASSTVVEKMIFDNDRPFVVAPEKIRRYDDGVNNFYSDSKSFPSGQANQSAWFTMLMAMALPELGPQLLARSSEVGMNRLVMGVHYPLDIIGGRMTGSAAAADRWNDPKMRKAIQLVGQEIRSELEWRAGMPLADAIAQDIPYRSDEQAVQEYTKQLSMGFEVIYDTEAEMIVPKAAPDLLLPFFPGLNYNQRMEILRQTAISSGSPLDNQGSQGSWQRLNFALAMVSNVQLLEDGGIIVN